MSGFAVTCACVSFGFLSYYVIRSIRPLNIGSLVKEMDHEVFRRVGGTWLSRFLTVQPICILKSRRHLVWYFRTESLDGCPRESLIVNRLLFAPLHVFYDNGKVTKVTGGAVKFEILEDEARSKANLEKLLKVVQAKHREASTNPLLN